MKKQKEALNSVISIIIGIIIVGAIYFITSKVNYLLYKQSLSYGYHPDNKYGYLTQLYLFLYWINYMLSVAAPFLGGLTVSLNTKKKPVLHGLILGIMVGIIPLLMSLLYLVYPEKFFSSKLTRVESYALIYPIIFHTLLNKFKVIVLTVLGTYIGTKILKNLAKAS